MLPLPGTEIQVTSANEMCKLYEMCKKGVRFTTLKLSSNLKENDLMVETFIKTMRLNQTHVSLNI